jgi:hypothetical protein
MTARALTFAARASVRVPNRAPMIEPPRPELNEQALTTGPLTTGPLTTMPRQPCLGDWESRDAF